MATLRRVPAEPIVVPALGEAFDFRIHAIYDWTGQQIRQEELRYRVDLHNMTWAVGVVRELSAAIARGYEPHRSQELEEKLNDCFREQRWPRAARPGQPQFTVRVWVRPDERVRERLRPYWEQRIALECEHELSKLRTEFADDLTRRWRDVLQSLEQDPVTLHAARLTGERFAEVFGQYVTERRQAVPELVTLLTQAVRGHGDLALGPSEYTEAWDVALRTYRRQYGLDEAA
ncbi:hypothetical protein GSF22_20515 [Micromonospora echinofusca]|uniref:Uncharacterized protein n=1 Tax=Micromonospora echinofusca TaxID=47858 RepID=A0ABS3VUZ3_MICEH|nr:hypothetical protein [Micromonospora echinofusca]